MAGADGLDRGDATRPFETPITYGQAVSQLLDCQREARATLPAVTIDGNESEINEPRAMTPEEGADHVLREVSLRVDAHKTALDGLSVIPQSALDDDVVVGQPTGVSIAEGDPALANEIAGTYSDIEVIWSRMFDAGRPAAQSNLRFHVGEQDAALAYITTTIKTRPASRLGDRPATFDLPVDEMAVEIETTPVVRSSPTDQRRVAAATTDILSIAHEAEANVTVDNAGIAREIVLQAEKYRLWRMSMVISCGADDAAIVDMGATTVAPLVSVSEQKGAFAGLRSETLQPYASRLAAGLTRLDPGGIEAVVAEMVDMAKEVGLAGGLQLAEGQEISVTQKYKLVPINTNFDRWMSAPVALPDGMSMDDVEGLEDYDVDPNDLI